MTGVHTSKTNSLATGGASGVATFLPDTPAVAPVSLEFKAAEGSLRVPGVGGSGEG